MEPRPSFSRVENASVDFTTPLIRGPASVTPMWRGMSLSFANSSLASIVSWTEDAFMLTTTFLKSRSSKTAASRMAVSARAFARVILFSSTQASRSVGRLPVFTPILMATPFSLQALTTFSTLSRLPMLPGFILITETGPDFSVSSARR